MRSACTAWDESCERRHGLPMGIAKRVPSPATALEALIGAESDQQDLVRQMETDRKQKPVRDRELVRSRDAQRRNVAPRERNGDGRQFKARLHHGLFRGPDERTFLTLARTSIAMLVVRLVAGAVRIGTTRASVSIDLRLRRVTRVHAAMRMVRTAAHHEVNHQHRSGHVMHNTGHGSPSPGCRFRPCSITQYNRLCQIGHPQLRDRAIATSHPDRRTLRSAGCRTGGFRRSSPLPCEVLQGRPARPGWPGRTSAGPSATRHS